MRILLTNDDGINAPGIKALWQNLSTIADVFVVAPSFEQSAMSQAITMHMPIRVQSYEFNTENVTGWSVDGTPTDCVKLALETLLTEKPSCVVSGINMGANLGNDILYSGTVSAAREGALHRIPSIAVSLDSDKATDFALAAKFTVKFVTKMLEEQIEPNTLFNVNVPKNMNQKHEDVAITKLGIREYENTFDRRQDPSGRSYYWMGGKIINSENEEDTDVSAIKNNKISITPIHFDLTDYHVMNELKNWKIQT
ncbi:5'/3'-nucleotidase SurE [Anaerosinus massiliensis]|uniref:5'/3'-nucleotidase SurE n=1 Tax=Massilibacillus massiliensis TaxID=1806837 RepID=UPI000ABE3DBC|nr:5'/3'-nucleotidase SurE [Massilibacillus massiliensis]